MRFLAFLLALILGTHAAEPFLQPHDVIALVGGEDLVVANELGYLETMLQRALPDYHLSVRSLAWEGDTVFEQHRDLNYPLLETQLDKIGATVVICHFGVVESLAGPEKIPDFITAYQKLLARLDHSAAHPASHRRIVLVGPLAYGKVASDAELTKSVFEEGLGDLGKGPEKFRLAYGEKIQSLAESKRILTLSTKVTVGPHTEPLRDGLHLTEEFQRALAEHLVQELIPSEGLNPFDPNQAPALTGKVREKNRLWFQYTRPQNWAFLAGDRTNQPSSRDYRDPSKRWFPDEMEQFVPLIEAKDKEIWDLAAKLKPSGQ